MVLANQQGENDNIAGVAGLSSQNETDKDNGGAISAVEERRERRRKRRWGQAVPATNAAAAAPLGASVAAAPPPPTPVNAASVDATKAKVLAMQESIRARLAAAKAKLSTTTAGAATATTTAGTAGTSTAGKRTAEEAGVSGSEALQQQQQERLGATNQTKRAKRFDLDLSVTAPTYTKTVSTGAGATDPSASSSSAAMTGGAKSSKTAAASQPSKITNPYLAHWQKQQPTQRAEAAAKNERRKNKFKSDTTDVALEEGDLGTAADGDNNEKKEDDDDYDPTTIDDRLERTSKIRKKGKALVFCEPGKWIEIAQQKRLLAEKAQESGYVSGRKTGHTIQSASMAQIYGRGGDGEGGSDDDGPDKDDEEEELVATHPRADAHPGTKMPLVMEWWDLPLVPGKLKKLVAAEEAAVLTQQSKAALKNLGGTATTKGGDEAIADDATTTSITAAAVKEGEDSTGKDGANNKDGLSSSSTTTTAVTDLKSRCFHNAALTHSKTSTLVQHIVPIKPPSALAAEAASGGDKKKQPVLHLTKKERKRQRKLRRQEKQRELQDMQAAGLLPAPEPRLTLKNFIQVLGDQAFLDPSQMEQKVLAQMQKRQQAHLERNQANKLTKEQRAQKRARKLQEDTSSTGVTVALFYVKDMSHPYHRAKVDLNAQQNNISGGVLECQHPPIALVICEGGPKAIKRYRRLMEVRMKWVGGPGDDYDDVEESAEEVAASAGGGADGEGGGEMVHRKFNPDNKCELVWQGIAVKRLFKGFVFQACETSEQARKVLKQKGVPQYWDQVLGHSKGRGSTLQLKLADYESSSGGSDNNGDDNADNEEGENDGNHSKDGENDEDASGNDREEADAVMDDIS